MRTCIFIKHPADIIQYVADISLIADDFYGDRKKRQSPETSEQEKIGDLVSTVCRDIYIYIFMILLSY